MRVIDRISEILAQAAAWLLFAIGLMLGYEVAARHLFNAPTIWASELSNHFMVWAVYVGAAALLRRDDHISVSVLTERLGETGRRAARVLSLLFILAVCGIVAWYGAPIAWDSFVKGRTTGSMLDIPTVWLQAAIPVGFGWLALQCLVELIRAAAGLPPGGEAASEPHRPIME